jgi:hypothetical protein
MSLGSIAWATEFLAAGILTEADVYPVALTAPRYGETDRAVLLALALAVRAPRLGHAGVDLRTVEELSRDPAFGGARSTARPAWRRDAAVSAVGDGDDDVDGDEDVDGDDNRVQLGDTDAVVVRDVHPVRVLHRHAI